MSHLKLPNWLEAAKSIAIVGFGREGQSSYRFLRQYLPNSAIHIVDEHTVSHPADANVAFSSELVLPDSIEVVFKTPGILASRLKLPKGAYLTSQADLFVQLYGQQTIAITGTKGKSTTAHAIDHVLRGNGIDCLLVGNIGTPAFDSIEQVRDQTVVVFEMSSFQTESLHVGTHISVCTSFYQDHLDVYPSFENYRRAKQTLFKLQTAQDYCIYRCDEEAVTQLIHGTRAKTIGYSNKRNANSIAFIENNILKIICGNSEKEAISREKLQVEGLTNAINCLPALILGCMFDGKQFDQSHCEAKAIGKHLSRLESLPGRLERVGTVEGVAFYDDALATIPEAAIAALQALPNVKVLLAGGHDRHQEFAKLAEWITNSAVGSVVLFPPVGERLKKQLEQAGFKGSIQMVTSMPQAVQAAFDNAKALHGDVLLSAGSPSFGLFTDYADRSRQYLSAIQKLQGK